MVPATVDESSTWGSYRVAPLSVQGSTIEADGPDGDQCAVVSE